MSTPEFPTSQPQGRQTLDPGSPLDICKSVLTKKYADFTGRARRAEYWWFVLLNAGVYFGFWVLGIILFVFNLFAVNLYAFNDSLAGFGVVLNFFYLVYALGVAVPYLAVMVRRLHDTNRSGWMLLLGLIPFVGWLVLLVFYFIDGDPGENQYGPSPKYVS